MKALVAVKRVVDYNIKVRIKDDKSGVDLDGIKMSMNPFCEIAVEQAVRLKEQGQVDEVVIVSIGESKAQEQIRHALAMGADRGILVETDEILEPIVLAQVLNGVVTQEQPDLVLMGKQSVDGDNAQTGSMLSALMNVPVAHCASSVKIEAGKLMVRYEVDNGEQLAEMPLPSVVSADLRLAEPRFVKLPNVMKAKKKPLTITTLAELGIEAVKHQKRTVVDMPKSREGNTVVCDSAAAFAKKLCEEMEG